MLRKPECINKFGYKVEDGQNPFTGVMSFQHFRGEKLYSDCIVRPEANYTETERFECYPVPEDTEENGREEGFYPDSSVAYIRVLWKEFEPEQGVYNYKFIEDILSEAKKHGQTLIFRLMAHSTRARDDVPEWLKKLMPCPERPDGMRVKDSPTDPRFVELFCEAIRKIGERFDDDPVFDAMDISQPGAWGEGHNLHLYPDELLMKLFDTYLSVFKKTQLIGQISRPHLLHRANKIVNIGWRGDGLGHPPHTEEYYPPRIKEVEDLWKTGPVSFEAYWWLGEWKRQGWSLDDIIDATLKWHISSFNPKSIPIPYEWEEKVNYWISKMGYHYAIDYFKYPENASPSDEVEFELCVDNVGVAPIYRKLPLKVRLSNGNNEYVFDTDVDILKWFPGKSTETFTVKLPDNIVAGEYSVELGIYNEIYPMVYFCTDAQRNGEFYTVGSIKIG